jgi:hypothetical protein
MKKRRSQQGSQIAEFGPALGIVFTIFLAILVVFPFFVAFAAGFTLNFMEVREAALAAHVNGQSGQLLNVEEVRTQLSSLDQELQASPIVKALNLTILRPTDPTVAAGYDGTMREIVVPCEIVWNSGLPFFGVKRLHFAGKRSVEHIE